MAYPKLAVSDLEHVFDHVGSDWQCLRGCRIFISGGSGFFGTWLLETLLWANERGALDARVTVLTRAPSVFVARLPHIALHDSVTLLTGSLNDFKAPSGEFGYVIHAAVETAMNSSLEGKLRLLESFAPGTRRMLDFAVRARAHSFLYTSSGAVYGPQPVSLDAIEESFPGAHDPLDPSATYGLGKRLAEHLCRIYMEFSGLPVRIARPFAFVGPHLPLDRNFAIGNFVRDGLSGETIRVLGDGTPIRSYLYAGDLAIWLWRILLRGKTGTAYNVGSEAAISIADTARLVASQLSPARSVAIQTPRKNGTPSQRYVPSTKLAQRELGLSQWIALPNAVQRTLEWNREVKTWIS